MFISQALFFTSFIAYWFIIALSAKLINSRLSFMGTFLTFLKNIFFNVGIQI